MSDRAAANVGFVAAGAALLGTLAADVDGRSAEVVLPAVAGVALLAFGLRRHGRLDRRIAAPTAGAAAAATLALLAVSVNGIGWETTLVAVGAGSSVVLAAADWRSVETDRLLVLTRATALAVLLGGAGLLSIAVLTTLLVQVVGGGDLAPSGQYLFGTLAIGPAAVAVVAVYLVGVGRGIDFLDLHRPSRRDVGYATGGAVALLGLNVVAAVALDRFGIESASHDIVLAARSDPGLLVVLVPLAYVSVGLGEELLYRNAIQKSLYDVFSRGGAIVVASVVFAGAHFTAYAGSGAPPAAIGISLALVFALSLVLGAIYERTENVLVPAFAHGTFDAAVYAVLYVEIVGLPA